MDLKKINLTIAFVSFILIIVLIIKFFVAYLDKWPDYQEQLKENLEEINLSVEEESVWNSAEVSNNAIEETEVSILQEAEELQNKGFYTLSTSRYLEVLKNNPDDVVVLTKIAINYEMSGKNKLAFEYYEKALKKDLEYIPALLGLGRVDIMDEKFDLSRELFLKVVRTDKNNSEGYYYLGALGILESKVDKSLESWRRVVDLNQDLKLVSKANNLLKAQDYFLTFRGSNELHQKVILAQALYNNGDFTFVKAVLKQVINVQYDYRDAWILLGANYLAMSKFEMAEDALIIALNLDKEKAETYYLLWLVKYNQEDFKKSEDYLIQALQNNYSNQAEIRKYLTSIKTELGEDVEYAEINDLQDVAKTHEEYYQLVLNLITKTKNYPQAVLVAEEYYRLNKFSPHSNNLLGWALVASQEYEKALPFIKFAIKKQPDFSNAYLNLGDLYKGQGNKEKAMESYQKCYEIDKYSMIGGICREGYNSLVE